MDESSPIMAAEQPAAIKIRQGDMKNFEVFIPAGGFKNLVCWLIVDSGNISFK